MLSPDVRNRRRYEPKDVWAISVLSATPAAGPAELPATSPTKLDDPSATVWAASAQVPRCQAAVINFSLRWPRGVIKEERPMGDAPRKVPYVTLWRATLNN